MKAIINYSLERPTRFGSSIVKKKIIARQECIRSMVLNFITERINQVNFIRVKEFKVSIFTHRGVLTEKWSYKPTYR